ncbi:unnamed protein product [Ectocarpus sp. CCAP 1310/34]|nr:unnamed protein product [Ectocarpus sp. CCAP 1310/34]
MSCMMVANRCFGRCFVAMSANIVALVRPPRFLGWLQMTSQ